MTTIFLLCSCAMIYLQYRREKNLVNLVSILMAPYVIIVFFNNLFFVDLGFYRINDAALIVFETCFLLFFVGGQFAMNITKNMITTEEKTRCELARYNIKAIKKVISCIVAIGAVKLCYAISTGNLTEGYMGNGIVGHLLLLSFSLVPILFLHWTYNRRDISCFLLSLCIIALNFTTLIKYNVISLIIVIFLFLSIYRRSIVKKAVVTLVVAVSGLFVLNYVWSFYTQGVLSEVENAFYGNHLWTYCSGALINANQMYVGNIEEEIGLLYKLMIYFSALPNMFLSALDVKIFGSEAFDFAFHSISSYGLRSNVLDAITRLYPADGDGLQVVLLGMFMLFIGFVFMRIYLRAKRKALSLFLPIFLTYFVFLSFFGTFYMLPGPWEAMIWSVLIPKLFMRRR